MLDDAGATFCGGLGGADGAPDGNDTVGVTGGDSTVVARQTLSGDRRRWFRGGGGNMFVIERSAEVFLGVEVAFTFVASSCHSMLISVGASSGIPCSVRRL